MFKQKIMVVLCLFTLIPFNLKTAMVTKQECVDRIEQFKKSENTLNAYLTDIRNDFNNFENEVKNIVTRAKTTVEKIGGNAQAKSYKEFATLKKKLKNKIRAFETILNDHVFMILMIEDCYFNRLISREKYENLFQLNQ